MPLLKNAFIFTLLLCCRINAQNEAAKKGLERLEKQMKVSDSVALSALLLIVPSITLNTLHYSLLHDYFLYFM